MLAELRTGILPLHIETGRLVSKNVEKGKGLHVLILMFELGCHILLPTMLFRLCL